MRDRCAGRAAGGAILAHRRAVSCAAVAPQRTAHAILQNRYTGEAWARGAPGSGGGEPVEGSAAEATGEAAVNGERADDERVAESVQDSRASCLADHGAGVVTDATDASACADGMGVDAVDAAGPDAGPDAGAAAAGDQTDTAVALSTPILLRLAARRGADLLAEALRPLRLHPRHYSILLALAEGGPTSQSALGQRLGIDRTTMVTAIDHLEQVEYVARRPEPADRRAHRVELTGRGRGRLVRATGAVDAAEKRLLAALRPDEVVALRALLTRLTTAEARATVKPSAVE